MRQKPSVLTKCPANFYAAPAERIIEFSSKGGGGLISFRVDDDGVLVIALYRLDPTVQVAVDPRNLIPQPGGVS
jgi:hypothetical protein